jgi:chaperonin cofactor prefoldin
MGAESTRAEAETRRAEIAAIAPGRVADPDNTPRLSEHGAAWNRAAALMADAPAPALPAADEIAPPPLPTLEEFRAIEGRLGAEAHEPNPNPRGGDMGDDGDEVSRVHEARNELDLRVHNMSVRALDNPDFTANTINGAMVTSAAAGAAARNLAQTEQEKRNESDRNWLLRQLAAHIGALQDEIDAINARLAEIDTRMHAIDARMQELDDAEAALDELETLSPDDPRYADALRRAGLTHEDIEREGKDAALRARQQEIEEERAALTGEQTALEDEQGALRTRKDDAQRSLNELQSRAAEIDELERTGAISAAEAHARREALVMEAEDIHAENVAPSLDLLADQSGQSAGPTPELDDLVAQNIDVRASADEEIGAFMRDLAEARQAEEGTALLAREKALLDRLSDDARYDIESQAALGDLPEAQALFEEGYFDALDEAPGADGESGRIPVSAPAP